MTSASPPSFSAARRWTFSLNVLISVSAVLALVLMANYLAARHFKRFTLSGTADFELSPITKRVLAAVTNEVKAIVYFDREEPLYDSVQALLKEYKFANARIVVETVDYKRDAAAAQLVKEKYKLRQVTDKNMVIFDCQGRTKPVHQGELSNLDVQALISGQSREVRRTHFKGELMFTSAILNVTSLRPLKACFLQGHQEHSPASDDPESGFSKFAAVLTENNIEWSRLSLLGTNDVPVDCNLLIIPGARTSLLAMELEKIDRYLKSGGRLLALFNYAGISRNTGLQEILSAWGVEVGDDQVKDPEHTIRGHDIVSQSFGTHPIVKPLLDSEAAGLYLVLPRSVRKPRKGAGDADASTVSELVFTGPAGVVYSDIRDGVAYPAPGSEVRTNVCLAVAVEKGKIKDVAADRGTTRLVVAGESYFLSNHMIDQASNREFAAFAVNWLLDRTQLLGGLAPKPIKEYKLIMTTSELSAARWILLAGMPGSVLLVGLVVSVRRRK